MSVPVVILPLTLPYCYYTSDSLHFTPVTNALSWCLSFNNFLSAYVKHKNVYSSVMEVGGVIYLTK